ncbi:MAG: vitamin B12 dependent-methionine synthase activation domain-containing protein [Desulfobacterales bacterium]|nr:vitamin B12 dependent-methionine synthase activation domain-containing protein [Desulfobacterales bacterium]
MSIAIKPSFKDLMVTPEGVARYAGGSHYKPDAERKRLAEDMLELASALVQPAFVYAAHHINSMGIEKGISLFLPPDELDAGTVFIVAAVCSIGPEPEKEISNLMAQGRALDALFLDAAGVAILEALSDEVHSHLKKEAAKEGLYAGCRFGPGYGNIPVDAQKILLESVNPEAIGVQLKESGVLYPLKSLSFWVMWTSQPPPEGSTYKCQNCTLKNCAYRIA